MVEEGSGAVGEGRRGAAESMVAPAAVGGGGGVRGRATDLAGGGGFRRARRRCEKERGVPGGGFMRGACARLGEGDRRRRHGLPWRRGGVAGLGLGLSRLELGRPSQRKRDFFVFKTQ